MGATVLVSPPKFITMVRKFKLDNVDYVLLTYSDCPDDFDPQLIINAVVGTGGVYRLGRELHQNGKPHFHCFVQWPEPFSHPDAGALFYVGGRRANIKRFSANPGRRWDYVGKYAGHKEGHYLIGDQCDRPGGDKDDSERTQSDIWSEIINATSEEEFFEKLAALAPKQLGCNFGSLKLYADWKYRPQLQPYDSPAGGFTVPEALADWERDQLDSHLTGRLCGPEALDPILISEVCSTWKCFQRTASTPSSMTSQEDLDSFLLTSCGLVDSLSSVSRTNTSTSAT
uniref:Replication associated protein n=1 Tax=Eptesicus serotinus feces associated gemykolovirus 2 TaxID=3139977 RepID=A0AAU6S5B6_9VIRU